MSPHNVVHRQATVSSLPIRLCLQKEFREEFDAVAAANAGKPVMLTG